jgi:tetratricopeptide (TPR) repeat protein
MSKSRIKIILEAAAILFAGWFVFAPGLRGGWLWDDGEEITQNAVLRDPAGVAKIWFSPTGADYLPFKTTVQWIGWRLWGDSPFGYHALSLALHLLSAFLFWRLLQKLGLRLAWLGGLLFVVHPVAVESVAWISELKNTLSLPLLLLAMLAYLAADEGRAGRPRPAARSVPPTANAQTNGYLLFSLLLFLLAMLSKASVVMFPVIILLYAWWKRGRIDRTDLASSAPFFAVSLFLGFVTVWFQSHRALLPGAGLTHGLAARLAGAGPALMFYLGKCVCPVGLLPIYPPEAGAPPSLFPFLRWLALAALVLWLHTRRAESRLSSPRTIEAKRAAWFGLGFFALNLLPVLGLVPMAYLDVSRVADHFAYLPLLGILGLATATAGTALDIATRATPTARFWLAGGLALLLGALAIGSRRYAANFRSAEALWTYALPRNPTSWAVRYNLANALVQREELPGAIDQYREALRLKPSSGESAYNLATALVHLDRAPEAVPYYEQALSGLPRAELPEAHFRYGNVLLQLGRAPEAMAHYEAALQIDPRFAPAESNLGAVLGQMGQSAAALEHLERAAQLDPDDAGAQNNLGNALFVAERLPEAIACYERALRLAPDYAEARANLEMARQALAKR